MIGDKTVQRAGDGSIQTVILEQNVVQGVSEERATEIARQQADLAVKVAYAQEAASVAHKRITRADQKIIAKLAANELLDVFGEPAFLSAYQRAQIGAAQTDSEDSYEILANLMVERARTTASPVRAATIKAIESVDLIDDKALCGLTFIWACTNLAPSTSDAKASLRLLEDVYSSLQCENLPRGRYWVDHLEALNLVREDRSSNFNKLPSIVLVSGPAWACTGYTSSEMAEAMGELSFLTGVTFHGAAISVNPYDAKRALFPGRSAKAVIGRIEEIHGVNGQVMSQDSRARVEEILAKMDEVDSGYSSAFAEDFLSREPLRIVSDWIDGISKHVRITHPGRAIAYANAKRLHALDGIGSLADTLTLDSEESAKG
ncbi:LPO_1073/Vpar_1526 family protein [Nocardia sp. NPDC058114]|uniref:LPO_1073/Vpar_1526 family protein n=1 Tax=Nocardia sp. NPDC058114 TaxID=3346346 RepID=UPI0036D79519